MPELEENTIYMILYNYQDSDYSIIKIMSTLEKAIQYIHQQEINEYTDVQELTLTIINKTSDSTDKCKEDNKHFYVCLFDNNDIYMNNNFRDTEHISSYIIVKTKVE